MSGSHSPQRRVTIIQGESMVSRDSSLVLTTILGSCVACCLHDRAAGVGGMNHFLLGELPPGVRPGSPETERYGLYAMEKLINAMLKLGATRSGLRAHLYGGANIHPGMRAIGDENARFALRFLKRDGIALAYHDLGGVLARRVDLQPALGRARSRSISDPPTHEAMAPAPQPAGGDVELF